ncbi:hypothetical protein G6645_01845 [Polynucleobacter paneuropaeus]|nr:hypothetical protein [Polynucleobacter paneuropaeus]MBT8531905.1 hypothetical protein [Polynucleobacter paneuropaeus]MBT8601537.1 hypothetical protein [Polynucleobacter paneuropaeus]MBT8623489.1 hypothetical protein [Polynucleobacter paneuropaeus]MBT8629624.1 hypothetical protein [Polynucleobacter paneuropaeus]
MNTELIEENKEEKSQLVITKSLVCQADDLAEEHEQFNTNYIIGGRLALYVLLGKMFDLYKVLEASPDKKVLLGEMKHRLVHDHRIRVQANSSDAGILVRYITRAERKTAHIYARVIEQALINQIPSEYFVDYIEQCGGIEQMRLSGVDQAKVVENEQSLKDNQELAWKYCKAREELPFASFPLKNVFDYLGKEKVWFEYYVCAKRGDKRYVVANIPADKAFEERAITLIGNDLATTSPDIGERVEELYEKAKQAHKERITKEMPWIAKTLEEKEQEEKGEV